MGTDPNGGIVQSGAPGSYTYSVKPGPIRMGSALRQCPGDAGELVLGGPVRELAPQRPERPIRLARDRLLHAQQCHQRAAPAPGIRGATYVLPTLNEWIKAGFHNAAA